MGVLLQTQGVNRQRIVCFYIFLNVESDRKLLIYLLIQPITFNSRRYLLSYRMNYIFYVESESLKIINHSGGKWKTQSSKTNLPEH